MLEAYREVEDGLVGFLRSREQAEFLATSVMAMRTGWFRFVHVKSLESQELRLLLTHRKALQRKTLDIENEIRGSLKTFGCKVGKVSRGGSRRGCVNSSPSIPQAPLQCE
jgi:transposase